MSFVHLHTHTQYSLLDGSNRIADYVSRVKELGMNSAAITDHGAMFGVIEFYKEAKKAGINPIIGCEVYVASGSRFDRETVKGEGKYYHLILLAENNTGYFNLQKIVSIGYVDGFYYRPRVDFETLEKYHEGIICLSACIAGEVPRYILADDYEGAKACAEKYNNCFGAGNYFLEMQDHGIAAQKTVNAAILRLHEETGIPLVITNDCHYTYEKDSESHDILLCIQTGKVVTDKDRMRYEGGQFFVKSEEEMEALFPYGREAMDNTQKIADRCHVDIEFGKRKLPHFDVPSGYTSETYLRKICEEGLNERYPNCSQEELNKIKDRLNFELKTINDMGFNDYFLIVSDFIRFAKDNGIPVGPGRGSAAGSIVAYSTKITDIDPLKYQLLFERFLNPERVSMPDIDIDFCINRRGDVIDYVVDKYGEECVSQIITFGRMKARNAIRDVGRAMDMPYAFVSNIANMVPRVLNISIADSLNTNPDMKKAYDESEEVHELLDMAMELENLPRNAGTHAAGVVITENPINEYLPLARIGEKKGDERSVVTQFEKDTVEELGLLKMDFLGLRNLTIIDDAIKLIKETRGEDIDVSKLPMDDKAVFDLISSGKTEGVFQLESPGMISFMKRLSPESLDDIIAGIALYRPGPMQFIPQYIDGKKDRASVKYDCKELEHILSPTYGCIVYQEQVMQIVRDLAGYSLGRSDILRRAMSKKKADVMDKEKDIFINGDPQSGVPGCIKNGIDEKVASAIYDRMLDFAKYAFNKSHAASYAFITYQTAYLKLYYPREYFAALLTSVLNNTEDVAKYIACAKQMNIEIMPPNINASEGTFTVKDNKIYYGMYAIKSVGTSVIDAIVSERNTGGDFKDLQDFINRILRIKKFGDDGKSLAIINKKAIAALILSGSLDCLSGNRKQKMLIYPQLMENASKQEKDSIAGQISLFDLADEENKKVLSVPMPEVCEYEKSEILKNEKEVMGIYVSGHPLDDYIEYINNKTNATSSLFKAIDEDDFDSSSNAMGGWESEGEILSENKTYTLCGIITKVTPKYTKRDNKPMAFVTVEDLEGSVEVIVFPNAYEKCKMLLDEDKKVVITGRASIELERDSKLICETMIDLENPTGTLWIQFADMISFEREKASMANVLRQNPGNDRIIIYIRETKTKKQLGFTVNGNESLRDMLSEKYGKENIKYVL